MSDELRLFHRTKYGCIYQGNSLCYLQGCKPQSVDLIVTSPPFGLVRKKEYGNVDADKYLDWFSPFGEAFKRVLKPSGSLVIDIGGAWIPGQPSRSLYHYELLIMLCRKFGFHLAQEFFWWNPSKLPSPAEWVTVRRIRVKDAVNCVWWLSTTPWPRASNRRVPVPYSEAMLGLLKNGYRAKLRPSGHDMSSRRAVTANRSETRGQGDGSRKSRCVCQEPGTLNCGMPGILAGLPAENGTRYIERCDMCKRFASDDDACMEYARLRGGLCAFDRKKRILWIP
ncbi:MAG: site-specific DNA-methyltransferase [Acidobacteria bacterium]|nr:site-specific DNA-methyltransferase [Acidobacteriota bacterium]